MKILKGSDKVGPEYWTTRGGLTLFWSFPFGFPWVPARLISPGAGTAGQYPNAFPSLGCHALGSHAIHRADTNGWGPTTTAP
jgi:hypothetical protein